MRTGMGFQMRESEPRALAGTRDRRRRARAPPPLPAGLSLGVAVAAAAAVPRAANRIRGRGPFRIGPGRRAHRDGGLPGSGNFDH